ncbi:hypothetical protein ACTXT7_015668 [Hymenolepis weldensis]
MADHLCSTELELWPNHWVRQHYRNEDLTETCGVHNATKADQRDLAGATDLSSTKHGVRAEAFRSINDQYSCSVLQKILPIRYLCVLAALDAV